MTAKRIGRPPFWTDEKKAEVQSIIVDGLTEGRSLASILTAEGMPRAWTVFQWLREDEAFAQQYARARDESGDVLEAKLQDVTEKVLSGELDPAAARVAADNLKWIAGKRKPRVYGETKADVSVSVSLNSMHLEAVKQLSAPVVDVVPTRQPALENCVTTVPFEECEPIGGNKAGPVGT